MWQARLLGADYTLTGCDLLQFSWQVARGMEYLSNKKVKYGDVIIWMLD